MLRISRWVPVSVAELDGNLLDFEARPALTGVRRGLVELLYFGVKQARACLFVGLFFAAVFSVPRVGVLGLPRYDVLLVVALAIQGGDVVGASRDAGRI